jgi:hypothetical protein
MKRSSLLERKVVLTNATDPTVLSLRVIGSQGVRPLFILSNNHMSQFWIIISTTCSSASLYGIPGHVLASLIVMPPAAEAAQCRLSKALAAAIIRLCRFAFLGGFESMSVPAG